MRLGMCALLFVVVACGTHSAQPAWPKPHDTGSDGGESLAPHESTEATAALEGDPHPAPPAADTPIAPVVAPAAPSDATTATVVSPDETQPLQVEDTVIEIKDDE